MYKIIHQIADFETTNYIAFNSSISRGHNYKLSVLQPKINATAFFHQQLRIPYGIDSQSMLSVLP